MKAGRYRGLPQLWLGAMIALSALAPLVSRHAPLDPVGSPLHPPSREFPLGTDALGRDLWSRLAYGGRRSLGAAFVAAVLTVGLGGAAGLAAGLFGGAVDRLVVWGANVFLAIPGLLLAMMLVAVLGPGFTAVVLAVGLGGAPAYARLGRTVANQILEHQFIQAAKALGADRRWITWQHLLPNARAQLIPLATTHFAWALLGTTTLTFLGLAGDPSLPEWGVMLNAGRSHLVDAPWVSLWPGLAITLTILAVHAVGESIAQPS